ncbi:MAG: hypothetical protein IJJ43_01510 [Oscillospiraceae bacterium]|nr:hypothetical protein [Oscillospiraceae bacterium]
MAEPKSLIPGAGVENASEDLKSAARVEQYRVSGKALYIPAGFRWNCIPFSAVKKAEEWHFNVTAGKCVAVTEKRPSLRLETTGGDFTFPLEKAESLEKLLAAIRAEN